MAAVRFVAGVVGRAEVQPCAVQGAGHREWRRVTPATEQSKSRKLNKLT